jgi:hypothetical protein
MIVAPHGPSTAVEIHMRHAPLTNAARRRECQLESCELQGEQELEPLATAHDVVQCMSIVLRRDGNAEHHDGGLAPSLIAKEKKEAAARIDPRSKASVEKGERDLPACISPVSGQHKRASQPAAHARGPKQRASMSAQNCNRPRVDSNSNSTDDCARLLLPLRRKTPPPPAVTGDNERSAKEQTDARGPCASTRGAGAPGRQRQRVHIARPGLIVGVRARRENSSRQTVDGDHLANGRRNGG